jgi:hypothetical protein
VKVAENGGPGALFSTRSTTRRLAAFTFFRLQRAKRPGSRFRHPLSLPQRDLFWLHELCPEHGPLSIHPAHHGSPTSLRPRLPIYRRPLSSGVYSLFRRDAGFKSRTYHHCSPARSHWTEPVSREETLARWEKFQKIGWFAPNHKPKRKKVIATVKRLWDKYVIRGCRLCLGITVRITGGVLSGIMLRWQA